MPAQRSPPRWCKLLSRGKVVASSQATYHGLKKPKEAFHDADLYRLYHKVSDEIESRGGSIVRVKLDYEMKRELYARLARATADNPRDRDTLREEVAKRYHLKVVSGRVPIPDLRIEYVNENDNLEKHAQRLQNMLSISNAPHHTSSPRL